MTCSDVQRVLPEMIDGTRNPELQIHLESCSVCSELVSDLQLIATEARQLAESDEPAPRVWLAIAAELRSEGFIREPEAQPARPVRMPARRRWNPWWLVPVAAAVLAVGSFMLRPQPAGDTLQQAQQQAQPQQPQKDLTVQPNRTTTPSSSSQTEAASNLEDQQFLQEVGTRAPRMRTTYENELRSVNSYIRDAKAYVDAHPGDEEARQQLMDAYEQKAMLYQMALDHIQ